MATWYSCRFCLRNNKKDTLLRIASALLNPVFSFLVLYATGLIVSSTQKEISAKNSNQTLVELVTGEFSTPLMIFITASLLSIIVSMFGWSINSRLVQTLRYANNEEIQSHRVRLGVARIKSREFDDLERQINELPSSWFTRVTFGGELLSVLTMVVSFITYGASVFASSPIYIAVLVVCSLPRVIAEFSRVNKRWELYQRMMPKHKERSVMERPFKRTLSMTQAVMFNQVQTLKAQIKDNRDSILLEYEKDRKETIRTHGLAHSIAVLGISGMIAHAVWNLVRTSGDIGSLTVLIVSARTFLSNLNDVIATIAGQWNSAKVVLLIEEEFFNMKSLVQTPHSVEPDFEGTPTICLKDLCFAYPDSDQLVLKNINLTFKPGQKVAIVGKSGSGKSSLVSVLMRHYDPTSGDVLVGDVNLRNMTPETWSKYAAALTQSFAIESRTLGREISASRLNEPVDLERVTESCRFAQFEGVVSSDELGFDRQIGTEFGGKDFAGGECQRIALARVHYRGSRILILDEPDSKLDALTAEKVMDAIFNLKGVTVILITHHVAYAKRCDMVAVLEDGEVAECGSPKELMIKEGSYARLLKKAEKRNT